MMITRCLSIKATVVIVLALICLLPIIILSNHSAIRSKINSFRKPNLVHQNYKKFDLHASDDEYQSDSDLDLTDVTLVGQPLPSNTQTVPFNEPPMENDHMPPVLPNSPMSWMSSYSESNDEFRPSEPFGSEEENKWFPLHFLDNQQNLMRSIDSGSVPPVQSIESDDLKTSLLDEESLLEMFSLISEKEWDSDDDQNASTGQLFGIENLEESEQDEDGCHPADYLETLHKHQFSLVIPPETPIISGGVRVEIRKQCPLNESVVLVVSTDAEDVDSDDRKEPGTLYATCENGNLVFENDPSSVECSITAECPICLEKVETVTPFDCRIFPHGVCQDCVNEHNPLYCPMCRAQPKKACASDPAKIARDIGLSTVVSTEVKSGENIFSKAEIRYRQITDFSRNPNILTSFQRDSLIICSENSHFTWVAHDFFEKFEAVLVKMLKTIKALRSNENAPGATLYDSLQRGDVGEVSTKFIQTLKDQEFNEQLILDEMREYPAHGNALVDIFEIELKTDDGSDVKNDVLDLLMSCLHGVYNDHVHIAEQS
eukprot:519514_1